MSDIYGEMSYSLTQYHLIIITSWYRLIEADYLFGWLKKSQKNDMDIVRIKNEWKKMWLKKEKMKEIWDILYLKVHWSE